MLKLTFILSFFALFSALFAAALPRNAELSLISTVDHPLETRDVELDSRQSRCSNTAATRQCWTYPYSVSYNYDKQWPTTGVTKTYNLEVQNITLAPDGISRPVYAINGIFPGPVVRANWGDTLQITVKNSLTTNGTSMHWHGIRQYMSNPSDGVNGITECPIAPGTSRTYTFLCTQFGTSWYHSHYSDQYADGVVGTIIIDGPTTSNYDIDLGAYPMTDWFYTPVFTLAPLVEHGKLAPPPPGDNILINGTNVNAQGGGAYARTTLTPNKKHKLRLINTSMQDSFQVGLDSHTMTVVASDFNPIVPYSTQWLTIGIGQRYDVIIKADQAVGNYWFHVVPPTGCGNNKNKNALSVFSYTGAGTGNPTSGDGNMPPSPMCNDDNSKLVPYVPLDVPSNYSIPQSSVLDVGFAITQDAGNQTIVQWNLNTTAIVADWNQPTMQYVLESNTNYPQRANIIQLPNANQWTYWVIQTISRTPQTVHPMHLHGHDFYVLGAGQGTFNDPSQLQYKNPPRRDVAMLPAGGWLVLAFITDNPGAWLMHCHIAFHISLGLGAQFLERVNDIPTLVANSSTDYSNQCDSWRKYSAQAIFQQTDSGL